MVYRVKIIILLFVFVGLSYSQKNKNPKITYIAGISLRDISQEYLGNADLWQCILVFNKYSLVDEINNGAVLEIPVKQITQTQNNISTTRQKIVEATNNGAEIFAKPELDSALYNLNSAVYLSNQNHWDKALPISNKATEFITLAVSKSAKMRNQMADATISDKDGTVEKRKPTSREWKDAQLYSNLYEQDRTRTLSKSFAEISFYDLSKFRLNENAQAVIQKSRVDLLKEQSNSSITLIEGDAFTKLVKEPKDDFKINIPGLSTKINSKYFWIEKNKKSTKLANYDGEITLSAKDSSVTVKTNQGTVVPEGGVPEIPTDLLPSPELLQPENGWIEYSDSLVLTWDIATGADQYWVEIATDPGAKNLVVAYKNLRTTSLLVNQLKPGEYFWRVTSVDKQGLPGKFSNNRNFIVEKDTVKPFLVIIEPEDNEITNNNEVTIIGKVESGCSIRLNSDLIVENCEDKFEITSKLSEGMNELMISAIDKSGNETKVSRRITYESNPEIEWAITSQIIQNGTIICNSRQVILSGITYAQSRILCKTDTKFEISTIADIKGVFQLNINNIDNITKLHFLVKSPTGSSSEHNYKLIIDTTPPDIIIETDIPTLTNKQELTLSGIIEEGNQLFINNKVVSLAGNMFDNTILLAEGHNQIEIVAKDQAGNAKKIVKNVFLDTTPPVLISYKLSGPSAKVKDSYIIEINAEDDNQLKKTAKVILSTTKGEKTFYIKNNGKSNHFMDTVNITDSPKVMIRKIILEDYSGNINESIITN